MALQSTIHTVIRTTKRTSPCLSRKFRGSPPCLQRVSKSKISYRQSSKELGLCLALAEAGCKTGALWIHETGSKGSGARVRPLACCEGWQGSVQDLAALDAARLIVALLTENSHLLYEQQTRAICADYCARAPESSTMACRIKFCKDRARMKARSRLLHSDNKKETNVCITKSARVANEAWLSRQWQGGKCTSLQMQK
jgi:hypothetical protein